MVARRRFSIRVSTGASVSSSLTTSSVSRAVLYDASGAFQVVLAVLASHGSNVPPAVANGWQMSGGPANAGTAADTTVNAAAATSEREMVNIDSCLLPTQTESMRKWACLNE